MNDEPIFAWVENAPSETVAFQEDKEASRHDPVMQHCKRSYMPIAWNRDTYRNAGKDSMWERQASFGLCAGIAVASHLPHGRHMFIGMDRDQSLPADAGQVTRMAADLQLFLACSLEPALRILLGEVPRQPIPDLTPRELEALRWTMEGKTAWELGRILGISEHTAARHVSNATQKLQCVNKMQAVMKALRLELIR